MKFLALSINLAILFEVTMIIGITLHFTKLYLKGGFNDLSHRSEYKKLYIF